MTTNGMVMRRVRATATSYLARRVLYFIVVILAVIFVVTVMFDFFPGNPVYSVLGSNATPAQIRVATEALHLNEGEIQRYVGWVISAAHGNLGTSFRTGVPNIQAIRQTLPVTFELVLLSQVLAILYALVTGLYAAYKPGGLVDRATTGLSFFMLSTPSFVLGIFLILVVAVHVGWFPVAGFTSFFADPLENLRSLTLPAVVLAAESGATFQRLLRGDTARTLREDYISMAYAKGLGSSQVLVRHALRPSLAPTVTMAGLMTARLIGGTMIVEKIFGLPGLGSWLISAVQSSDYPSIQAGVVVIAAFYVVINTFVDLSYRILDPRLRAQ
jgi:peptide/nickel transport system permease protein